MARFLKNGLILLPLNSTLVVLIIFCIFCSKLPDRVQEAMSSIIFAASRCGELPELHSLRNLFKEIFGEAFDRLNVELLPGNAVNAQTKQYLTATKLKEDVKLQIMDE